MVPIWLTAGSAFQVQAILLLQPLEALLLQPIFSRDGFCHVGQASLELLTSGDLPALASQSTGIIGVSCHAPPGGKFYRNFIRGLNRNG